MNFQDVRNDRNQKLTCTEGQIRDRNVCPLVIYQVCSVYVTTRGNLRYHIYWSYQLPLISTLSHKTQPSANPLPCLFPSQQSFLLQVMASATQHTQHIARNAYHLYNIRMESSARDAEPSLEKEVDEKKVGSMGIQV